MKNQQHNKNEQCITVLAEERRKKILDVLTQRGAVTVKELSGHFDVAPITIRRDFEELENRGLLVRGHGGAMLVGEPFLYKPLPDKESLNHEAKVTIGRKAASMIQDGETIILDEGSTCIELARALGTMNRSLTVVTNGIKVAMVLAPCSNITTILVGGICGHQNYVAYGHDTVEAFKKIRAHKYFMGIDALQAGYGISDGDPHQVPLKLAKASSSHKVIGVADRSKVGKIAVAKIGPLGLMNQLIMDARVPEDFRASLSREKVELIELG